MHFLLLNQTFHPDVASTAQHLSDLGLNLVERGHQVTVVSSRRAYDDPARIFPRVETWHGIRIYRISSTGFGKGAKWRRVIDCGSFLFLCAIELLLLPRPDVVVALTSPPLISFLGAWFGKMRGSRFFYWVMDFNPDEAIAAGWLRKNSLSARVLEILSGWSLRSATKIIALDRFMRDRIVAKGIAADKVVVLPPWSQDREIQFDSAGREIFRRTHGLQNKFVVMYSGNHSPCHPLDTLLQAADQLREEADIVFCFVGGGSEFRRMEGQRSEVGGECALGAGASLLAFDESSKALKRGRRTSALCLPYQPRNGLSASLSAADLHVVIMGNPFVGLVHPCKIYNILGVAAPVLYIGPRPSHVSEMLDALKGSYPSASAKHGDVEAVVRAIKDIRRESPGRSRRVALEVFSRFMSQVVVPQFIDLLEKENER